MGGRAPRVIAGPGKQSIEPENRAEIFGKVSDELRSNLSPLSEMRSGFGWVGRSKRREIRSAHGEIYGERYIERDI